jgi:hypothetical protein
MKYTTIMAIIPATDSRRTHQAAKKSRKKVMTRAMAVRVSSTVLVFSTTTRNWTVKARKKKKSNLRRAM